VGDPSDARGERDTPWRRSAQGSEEPAHARRGVDDDDVLVQGRLQTVGIGEGNPAEVDPDGESVGLGDVFEDGGEQRLASGVQLTLHDDHRATRPAMDDDREAGRSVGAHQWPGPGLARRVSGPGS
jgi:hypothetical protein